MRCVKDLLILIIVTVFTGVISTGVAMAGNTYRYGPGACIVAEPVTIYGVVKNISAGSPGMVIDNGSEDITVYGVGPVWYWRSIGVARPAAGKDIKVYGYKIILKNGNTRLVAEAIDLDGQKIRLRDARTGMPLWRRHYRNKRGYGRRCWRWQ